MEGQLRNGNARWYEIAWGEAIYVMAGQYGQGKVGEEYWGELRTGKAWRGSCGSAPKDTDWSGRAGRGEAVGERTGNIVMVVERYGQVRQ